MKNGIGFGAGGGRDLFKSKFNPGSVYQVTCFFVSKETIMRFIIDCIIS